MLSFLPDVIGIDLLSGRDSEWIERIIAVRTYILK
jgi:hypothetical protein